MRNVSRGEDLEYCAKRFALYLGEDGEPLKHFKEESDWVTFSVTQQHCGDKDQR